MIRTKINKLLESEKTCINIFVQGWVKTRRDSKDFSFLEINDGSCLKNLQVLVDSKLHNFDALKKLLTGSSVSVTGDLVASPGKGQAWELKATEVSIIHENPEDYPLQKKRHTDEYLRTIAHLRPRTNKYSAAFRIRSELCFAIHRFFNRNGFHYIHTPIITSSDCEGAGELFRVTTLKKYSGDHSEFSEDFFGKESYLTVSGQLAAEMLAAALGDVYTFGPTFRAENSNTKRHVAEFWMIEPEMSFCDLQQNMAVAEDFLRTVCLDVVNSCKDDIDLFAKYVDISLHKNLNSFIENPFEKVSYRDAVDILKHSKQNFENNDIRFGMDLQSEHERYLTEEHFKKTVIVFDYPESIKPFYMRQNNDNETVAAMDILVPGIGEIIGGSQREERYDVLKSKMEKAKMNLDDYAWYLDSRKYGSVPHSGFGLGLERFLMLITGSNIRDVIPFPRTPKHIEF